MSSNINNMKLSVVIPSYKDPCLHKTVDSILENSALGNELEIIVVLDGYWPAKPLVDDPRVKLVHLGGNRGMRGAINAGVAVARGEYLMRTDEHCMFAKDVDKEIIDNMEDDWIVVQKRFFLDPDKWEVMDMPPVEFEKLVIQGGKKFAGQRWPTRTKEKKDVMIDETMAMQGSCWFMKRSWWEKVIVELDTKNYGPLIQDSHEMVFKTWQAGGKMMLNKNTWYAHKHRGFSRTHNNGTKENPANCEDGYAYGLKVWKDYYENEIKPKWNI